MSKTNKRQAITKYVLYRIQTGIWAAGSKISSEGQLAIMFDTTIQTIHKTLLQFVDKGVLSVKPKIGYFVDKNNYISPNDFLGIKEKKYLASLHQVHAQETSPYANCEIFEFKTFSKNELIKIHYIFIKKNIMQKIKSEVFNNEFVLGKKIIKPTLKSFNVRQCLALVGEIVYSRKDVIKVFNKNKDWQIKGHNDFIDKNIIYIESKTYNDKNKIIEFAQTFINPKYINLDIYLKIKK